MALGAKIWITIIINNEICYFNNIWDLLSYIINMKLRQLHWWIHCVSVGYRAELISEI